MTRQLSIFDMPAPPSMPTPEATAHDLAAAAVRAADRPHFDGETYDPLHDRERLGSQLWAVRRLMDDGQWRTLAEIREDVGGSEAGISARLRDLRKSRWGGFVIERRRRGEASAGLWEYRLAGHAERSAW